MEPDYSHDPWMMPPDAHNARAGKTIYRCTRCGADKGLHWFGGTTVPVCSKSACTNFCCRLSEKRLQIPPLESVSEVRPAGL